MIALLVVVSSFECLLHQRSYCSLSMLVSFQSSLRLIFRLQFLCSLHYGWRVSFYSTVLFKNLSLFRSTCLLLKILSCILLLFLHSMSLEFLFIPSASSSLCCSYDALSLSRSSLISFPFISVALMSEWNEMKMTKNNKEENEDEKKIAILS